MIGRKASWLALGTLLLGSVAFGLVKMHDLTAARPVALEAPAAPPAVVAPAPPAPPVAESAPPPEDSEPSGEIARVAEIERPVPAAEEPPEAAAPAAVQPLPEDEPAAKVADADEPIPFQPLNPPEPVAPSSPPVAEARPEEAPRSSPWSLRDAIEITPVFSFAKIDATDATDGVSQASLLSGLNAGAAVDWTQVWSETWSTRAELGLLSTSWQAPSTKTLDNPSQLLGSFDLGVTARLGDHLALSFDAGMQQELFVSAASAEELRFDRVAVPALRLGVEYDFVHTDNVKLGVQASGGVLVPASAEDYSVHLGTEYGGGLVLARDYGGIGLSARLGFDAIQQDSGIATQKMTSVSFELGLKIRLGGEIR